MSLFRSARNFMWGVPPSDSAERKLLLKIDFFVLTFTCAMYWSNYLSRANLANAYVSGMREDVGFHGTQFNQVNTVFTIGYIVGQLPNNLMLQVVPPRLWLPSMALIWAGLSGCLAAVQTPRQVMAIRFLQALAESSTFSGSHYILGSWYKESELGKRSGIFASSAQLGSIFSGVMQAAILTGPLNGHLNLAGWRWLFLLDLFIGVPIALYGYLTFPDTPRTTTSFFLTEEERKLAVSRLPERPMTKLSWDLLSRTLKRWHWYAFSMLFAWSSMLESVNINSLMQLWLTNKGFAGWQRNLYPLGLVSVAIISTILCANLSDHYRSRWPVNILMCLALFITSTIMLIPDTPASARFAAFYLSGIGYSGQASNFAWANDCTALDEQERAVVLSSMNMWSNVVNAWWSITLYPATDAPRWQKGFIAMVVLCFFVVAITFVVRHLDHKERRERAALDESERSAHHPREDVSVSVVEKTVLSSAEEIGKA
ncbi:MFS general substrate transporter [Tilletiaria anomala UBC 951]|uniref:MFS general substrate transporter n=1 Tax=Tilletiaria anomala (strain ATCC 24038 / CBS 436.72 / UBC 951) TaxID=1037660 RepID=A0A066WQN2_TILAU|nr:MFS general substrate transporter [Tilletiaria anomala UBC 951]KDN53324.1 MFS general substrate transporter [Tilletiaria anomala UBC 951]